MKNKKNIKWIIIAIVAILLLAGIVAVILLTRKDVEKEPTSTEPNQYDFAPAEELPGTTTYTSDVLKAEHCLDSICVEEVSFYYTDDGGRIEYTVVNKTNEPASGLLKLVFGDQSLFITYQDVAAGGKVKTATFYSETKIKKMEDYRLEYLSEEDNKKIIYSK